eukprot:TRINITY_DN1779_c0_g1_i1.p1 TRINITY_DN1779_c0_g1~~TRINITY_DN1779_c0_g1_i1.p1  ORF type:complete len:135 (-),score=21.96 TRINITY_DN1779_c0_g1_i1:136-540(-)
MYSIISKKSFEEMEQYKEFISKITVDPDKIPLIMVGNKTDRDFQREVSFEDGRILATSFGCYCFVETSAKHIFKTNIMELFTELIRAVRKFNEMNGPSNDPPSYYATVSSTNMEINYKTQGNKNLVKVSLGKRK